MGFYVCLCMVGKWILHEAGVTGWVHKEGLMRTGGSEGCRGIRPPPPSWEPGGKWGLYSASPVLLQKSLFSETCGSLLALQRANLRAHHMKILLQVLISCSGLSCPSIPQSQQHPKLTLSLISHQAWVLGRWMFGVRRQVGSVPAYFACCPNQ